MGEAARSEDGEAGRVIRKVLVVGIVALAAAGSAGAKSAPPRFGFIPQRVFQGKQASISVLAPRAGVPCTLAVAYANGAKQDGLASVVADSGRAQWTWTLPLTAPVGPAVASVSCGGSARITRRFTVVGGTVLPSKLEVAAQGWSQRPDTFGSGSSVSYGVQLRDPTAKRDATGVTVQVNFLDAAGTVLGTASSNIPTIGASTMFNPSWSSAAVVRANP